MGGLSLSAETEEGIARTVAELMAERSEALSFLQNTQVKNHSNTLVIFHLFIYICIVKKVPASKL